MIFWSSAEMSPEAADAYREVVNRAEETMNELLRSTELDPTWSNWKWAFIAIIISRSLGVEYPERTRRDQKRRVLEFRRRIDFDDFTKATRPRQIELVFEQLHHSVDLMAKWKMSGDDRAKLHQVLLKTHATM